MNILKKEQKIHYTLRIASSMCLVGHGAFGVITKKIWLNYFGVFGIAHSQAFQLMPWLGTFDILIGVFLLFYPTRAFLLWLVIWGSITALLRPLSGEPFAEAIERAGNYGAPLVMLILYRLGKNTLLYWFTGVDPDMVIPEKRLFQAEKTLRIIVFLLLAGHGWLNILEKKALVDQFQSLGFSNPIRAAHIVGVVEFFAANIVLIRPVRPLLLLLFFWKMGTELFYPRLEIFEWIERGGSYGSILALYWISPSLGSNLLIRRRLSLDPK
ncbi:hypothetical protein [Mucilaginibacter sp. UYCu711]|uniref:hypothetical protein n=1 Tax=Mucilaginibacter sp. UYCu711 TaxID=3156339 RepID=UPI003D1FA0FB